MLDSPLTLIKTQVEYLGKCAWFCQLSLVRGREICSSQKSSQTHRTAAKLPLPNAAAAKRCSRLGRESVQSCTLSQKEGASTMVMLGSPRVLAQPIIITCRRPHGVPSALACPRRRLVCRAEQSRAAAQVRLIGADSRFALETTSAAALVPSSWENVENSFSLVCIIKCHRPRKEPRPTGSCSSVGKSVRRHVVG